MDGMDLSVSLKIIATFYLYFYSSFTGLSWGRNNPANMLALALRESYLSFVKVHTQL